jgi:hypothetical protein
LSLRSNPGLKLANAFGVNISEELLNALEITNYRLHHLLCDWIPGGGNCRRSSESIQQTVSEHNIALCR